ncbi:MAG TPA: DUF4292 domain-containing protein [Syntrophales bacterium]|nr:DUF4292 domain-containing protein [Syntrophales bacterium]
MGNLTRLTEPASLSRKLVILFCLLGSLAGCAHREFPVLSEADMPPAETLYSKITAAHDPEKTLTGILRVVAGAPGTRYSFKIAAAAKRPDRLRLEDLSVIGLPDFMLTVNGSDVRMFFPRTGEFLVGTESSAPIRRIFPPSVRPLDLVALLYGQPPNIFGTVSLKGSIDDNRFRLDIYTGGNWAQSLWVDPQTGRLAKAEIADSHGKTAYRASFSSYTEMGSAALPARIEIETTGMDAVRVSIQNTEMELVARDDEAEFFHLKPPEGVNPKATQ